MAEGSMTEAQLFARAQFERVLLRRVQGIDYLPSPAPTGGASARTRLIDAGTLQLYRYQPRVPARFKTPLLIVMSTGHRGYVADLAQGDSLVEYLLDAGFDLFMLEWDAPRPDENYLKLENYVLDFLPRAASRVRRETGSERLSVIGYRVGGVLALLWSALSPERGPRNLVAYATPYDWSRLPLLRPWADRTIFDVDKLIERFGCAPVDALDMRFDLEGEEDSGDQVQLWRSVWAAPHRRATSMFVRWAVDMLPQPGELFRQYVKRLLWENRLLRGSLEVGGRHIDPGRVEAAFLQIFASRDRIVPAVSARPLLAAIGSRDKTELVMDGGHADLFMGAARDRLWPALSAWLAERSDDYG
ncbi:alpha/beta hydrolase [Sphingomonas sanxanigenens]|uniref:AB hydrolase-1 domain-containing protein n=1 Tax=Sphingomonas sanxanigenens DSM 19645 = NX02 TaxID=1123269 RepID=W0AE14_9SPHN|nr:alpha/beta hydrolase [Sphingomonas sanxanigenens]AHE56124.1 hypothetical protein NX02_22525 [Sphingomonas sanxanigenens DSM 19645 = NX02]